MSSKSATIGVVLQRDYPDQVCSIARSLEVVGERWTLLILRDAVLGIERFEEFQDSLGIATNVLTNRLKLLCDEGVLERVPDDQRPGRPKYLLTEKGSGLAPALIALMKWGDRHYPTPNGPPREKRKPPFCCWSLAVFVSSGNNWENISAISTALAFFR